MKKYKLIKKLPFEGSPDIGYISTKTMEKDGAHYWNHNWFHPEDYPEFWEEVKDYQILSMKNSSGYIYPVKPNENLTYELKHHTINSVLRMSDNTTFTIDDIIGIHYTIGGTDCPMLISKIYYKDDILYTDVVYFSETEVIALDGLPKPFSELCPKLCVPVGTKFRHKNKDQVYTISSHQWNVVEISWLFIEQECKAVFTVDVANQYFSNRTWIICNPLFKTEDGVEIFEDNYFCDVDPCWVISRRICGKEFEPLKDYKYFSTKEAARNYVNMNKPLYSKKDIIRKFPELNGKL